MKYIKAPFVFILWLQYWLFTGMDAYDRYTSGKMVGMHCYKADMDAFGTTYYYDPKRLPVREWLTWKEFWGKLGYYKNLK